MLLIGAEDDAGVPDEALGVLDHWGTAADSGAAQRVLGDQLTLHGVPDSRRIGIRAPPVFEQQLRDDGAIGLDLAGDLPHLRQRQRPGGQAVEQIQDRARTETTEAVRQRAADRGEHVGVRPGRLRRLDLGQRCLDDGRRGPANGSRRLVDQPKYAPGDGGQAAVDLGPQLDVPAVKPLGGGLAHGGLGSAGHQRRAALQPVQLQRVGFTSMVGTELCNPPGGPRGDGPAAGGEQLHHGHRPEPAAGCGPSRPRARWRRSRTGRCARRWPSRRRQSPGSGSRCDAVGCFRAAAAWTAPAPPGRRSQG